MKKLFPGHFANSSQDIENLWHDCTFVLDANILLSLYRYSDSTRSDLLTVFDAFAKRLWIPHQVAHEYLTNRLFVISEQAKFYDDAIKRIDGLKKLLENNNQHPFVAPETLNESSEIFEKLTSELSENRLIHDRRITQDEIKEHLLSILSDKVGEGYEKDRLEEIILEGKSRYEEKTPPGFGDAKKGGDSALFLDRCKPYGDYVVWLQMMDYAKTSGKPIIFVTADVKEDWWTVFQGKTVGPHPQLIQEFLTVTNHAFYMYTPDKFLERASSYLDQAASEKSVQEIRDLQKEDELEVNIFDRAMNTSWPEARHSKSAMLDSHESRSRIGRLESELPNEFIDLPWNKPAPSQNPSERANYLENKKALVSQITAAKNKHIAYSKRLHEISLEGSSDSHQIQFIKSTIRELEQYIYFKEAELEELTIMSRH